MKTYPNLTALAIPHPYSYATFADHANVTTALFMRVLQGKEELTEKELAGISRLVGIDAAILGAPELIPFPNTDKDNIKEMTALVDFLEYCKRNASGRSVYFQKDIEETENSLKRLRDDFSGGKASYCEFLAIQAKVKQCLDHLTFEVWRGRKKRG